MQIETRYLETLLSKIDDLVIARKISEAEYMQIGLLMKIYQSILEIEQRGLR